MNFYQTLLTISIIFMAAGCCKKNINQEKVILKI